MNIKNKKMKNSFIYEYETTRERKFWNVVENIVNYGLALTFGIMVFGGIIIALINLL